MEIRSGIFPLKCIFLCFGTDISIFVLFFFSFNGASISVNMLKVFFVFVIKRKANGYVMTGEIYPAFAACVTQALN